MFSISIIVSCKILTVNFLQIDFSSCFWILQHICQLYQFDDEHMRLKELNENYNSKYTEVNLYGIYNSHYHLKKNQLLFISN